MKILKILKPSRKKVIFLIIILAAIFLGFSVFGQKKQALLHFAEVKKGEIRQTVASSGTLTGKEVADLKFKSSGKLQIINVKPGDTVKAGTLIAALDTKQLEINLQEARNTLVAKDATAKRAEDDVKNHDKDESFTQKETRTAAQVTRDNAYDEVKAAEKALSDAYIYTPISGLVIKAPPVAGQNVISTDLIAQIVNITEIYFETEVDEADMGKISLGQKAKITLDAYPEQTFEGMVDQIIPRTQKTTSGANVVIVRIKLENPPANFVQGLSGQSDITISQSPSSLYIPIEALRDDKVVVVKSGESFKEVKVVTGIQSDTDVEIKEGLPENQTVLLDPPLNLNSLKKNSLFP